MVPFSEIDRKSNIFVASSSLPGTSSLTLLNLCFCSGDWKVSLSVFLSRAKGSSGTGRSDSSSSRRRVSSYWSMKPSKVMGMRMSMGRAEVMSGY